MNDRNLARQLRDICGLIKDTEQARAAAGSDASDMAIKQSHWARYICILCAGYIETAIRLVYTDYAKRTVSQPVAQFVEARLKSTRNPNSETILTIAAQFKKQWHDDLKVFMGDDGRGEAIDSIMENRHRIAHGRYYESRVSIQRIRDYFDRAVKVIEFIEDQCDR